MASKSTDQRVQDVVVALAMPWIVVGVVLGCWVAHRCGWGVAP